MVSLFRVASLTGLLIAAATLYGCGSSGGGNGPGTSDGDMGTGDDAAPSVSMLTDAYDIVPDGGYPALPPDAKYLIADVAAAQMRTGGSELAHSRGRFTYGANRINTEANLLIVGPRVGNWDRSLEEFTCSGRVCASNPPAFEINADHLGLSPDRHANVLQKNGISVLQWTWEQEYENPGEYGHYDTEGFTLLSDVAFGSTNIEEGESFDPATDVSNGEYRLYDHYVTGFSAGTNPGGDATYRGLMMGSVVEKDLAKELEEPNWVIGDADFQFDLAALELDATFTNVVGLVSGQTFADLEWTGVSVDNGVFKQVVVEGENYIEGAFFGASQEGTAGVFEQNSIFGTFSAMDPQADVEPGLTEVDNHALKDLALARSNTDGMAPDFTVEEYTTAAQAILDNADELIAGVRIVSWGDRLHDNFNCQGRTCAYDAPPGGISYDVELDELRARPGAHEVVMRKNGIAVAQFAQAAEWHLAGTSGWEPLYGLGLWGEENIVWTEFGHGYYPGWFSSYANWVAGTSSGTSPTGDATYTGAMAGSVIETDPAVTLNTPDWVMGDAELTYSLADNSLDATFSNIVSLESGTSHNDLSWEDVPIVNTDQFATGEAGDYLIGEFFGADHEGVGGTFMQDSIAGVFTARQ